MSIRLPILLLTIWLALTSVGCNRSYDVGDHVWVKWEGDTYPAMITEVPAPGKVRVHFDGFDDIWDKDIPRSDIVGRVEGTATIPPPPEKVKRTAVEASKTNRFKYGDTVKVDWHGHIYDAVIIGVVGPERYRVHYKGYGNEWDENIGRDRIKGP